MKNVVPMISSDRYPLMRSAPLFQLVIKPSRIEHEDRVIFDAVDQTAKPVFVVGRSMDPDWSSKAVVPLLPGHRSAPSCF